MIYRRRHRLLFRLTVLNLAIVLALWAAETFIAERYWLTTVLTYMPQHAWGVPSLLVLLAALCLRQRRSLILSACALAFFAFTMLGVNLPLNISKPQAGPGLRIMTYNIHHGSGGLQRLAKTMSDAQPDIICLQEANDGEQGDNLGPELEALLGDYHVVWHGGLATLSRYPIVSYSTSLMPASTGRVVLETVVRVRSRRVAVLNVHLNTAAPGYLRRRFFPTPRYMQYSALVRSEQVSELLRVARRFPGPVVVAGDFNTPPRGLLYRRTTSHLKDAFRAAGRGTGYTYPAKTPIMRIDYILVDEDLQVTGCRVAERTASDHLPVVAEISPTVPASSTGQIRHSPSPAGRAINRCFSTRSLSRCTSPVLARNREIW